MKLKIDTFDVNRMPIGGVVDLSSGIGHVAILEATLLDDEGRVVEDDSGWNFHWTRNLEPFGEPGKTLNIDRLTDIVSAEDVFGCHAEPKDAQ